ncbi:hypothetical protein T11_266 [Trichinella zimbabwensis]|uniref:MULE transposase domain-containing protein n=1 Tax=Trichinella zimbabwensis TaxID=268475 RepID=A0A0V1H1R1_9BILA|nr:hypothetical protein T11_266 [Trichinella zimbabwensis]
MDTLIQQVLSGNANVGDLRRLVPAVYCLCTGKDIGTYRYVSQALLNKAAVLRLNLNPETIICDFETALIPAILDHFLNTRVQGCYFHFCQAEETKRKIRMVLDTAFLPVPHVHTGVYLLEAGAMSALSASFQYFRQLWMSDERLPL